MKVENSLLNTRKFLPLFSVQFLNAMSDHMLKNAILVMITYQGLTIGGLSRELSVNISTLLFILPFFLFSSYAGKIADMYSKVKLIRYIKICEIFIIVLAATGIFSRSVEILIFSLVAMGTHSTFFGPIKFSILPQYIKERKVLLLANGYIELGTFVAVLIGQTLGSWYMANEELEIIVGLMTFSTISGLILSYRMEKTMPLGTKEKFHWNLFKDTWLSYRKVVVDKKIKNNIHAISWFWAMGVVYSTQLPVFTQIYMGGCAHVFSILLAIFSISIGLGSLICAKISDGKIVKQFVILGSVGMAFFSMILIGINFHPHDHCLTLAEFSTSWYGVVNYILIFMIGFSAGFYSVTCYNELQVISPIEILSQVIGVNNVLNSSYMLLCSLICILLLFFVNLWWLFVVMIVSNLLFAIWYWRVNFRVGF
jgi:MFS family permease